MSLHRVVDQFEALSVRCRHRAELFAQTEAAAGEIGFPKLALVHRLWFYEPGHQFIRMDNFDEWADIFIHRRYYLECPILLSCQRTNSAFGWPEVPRLLPALGVRQQIILDEASRHG